MNKRYSLRISNDPRCQRFFQDIEKLDKSKWPSKTEYVLSALDAFRDNKNNSARRISKEEIADVVREVIREELQSFFNSDDDDTDDELDESQ